jgi:hypothetical protein
MKKQIKDSELWELDFLVAKAEGLDAVLTYDKCFILKDQYNGFIYEKHSLIYSPTTNPSQAWPIIERERIELSYGNNKWTAEIWENDDVCNNEYGKTSLEAAMRAYVLAKFGGDVDIDNLINK